MFTGLVEEIGHIVSVGNSRGARLLQIAAAKVLSDLQIDDSIAVNGACLTVIARSDTGFSVEAVEETLNKTTLGSLTVGDQVNLERALTANSRLGGHFVQGHIDGVARVEALARQAGGRLLRLFVPESMRMYLVPKGSIAVDGVSLTIAEISGQHLSIALIPHTLEVTTLGKRKSGDTVNIEVDMLGKYVYNLLYAYVPTEKPKYTNYGVKFED